MIKRQPLMSTSRGLVGTIENAEHHAPELKDMVEYLAEQVEDLPYKATLLWKQGNNVHLIITDDGRTLCFRPFREAGGGPYKGISLALKTGNKRVDETVLYEARTLIECDVLLSLLSEIIIPVTGETGG